MLWDKQLKLEQSVSVLWQISWLLAIVWSIALRVEFLE